jgi:glucose-1-phosphate thymidylyltransferase
MKCILLAAGYATRLYPLTKDKPKSLLEVGGKPVIEHIIAKIEEVEDINRIYIVSNAKFHKQFESWASTYSGPNAIEVLNDQTTSNEDRLGAIADIDFAVRHANIREDLLVLAGDNIFDMDLRNFVSFFQRLNKDCIAVHEVKDTEALRKTGVAELDQEGKVVAFVEKPQHPRSNLAVPPFYLFKPETVELIGQYLQEGNNPDAPGHYIPWLIKKKEVYAYQFNGKRYDIGTVENYKEVQEIFGYNVKGE